MQGTIVRTQILAGHHDFHDDGVHRRRDPADRRGSGMDMGAVFIATCPASAFGSVSMPSSRNYPTAPAMTWA